MIEHMQKLAKDTDTAVLCTYLIYPDGRALEYLRLVCDIATTNESMFKFYTDDIHHAMWKAIEEDKDDE